MLATAGIALSFGAAVAVASLWRLRRETCPIRGTAGLPAVAARLPDDLPRDQPALHCHFER